MFKVGDRVRVKNSIYNTIVKGHIGDVVNAYDTRMGRRYDLLNKDGIKLGFLEKDLERAQESLKDKYFNNDEVRLFIARDGSEMYNLGDKLVDKSGYVRKSSYNDELTDNGKSIFINDAWDIMEVYSLKNSYALIATGAISKPARGTLLWKREDETQEVEYTMNELSKKLGLKDNQVLKIKEDK